MVPIQRSYDSRVWVCLWGPLGLFADTSCWQRVVGRRLVLCIITEPRNSWLRLELSSVLNLLIVFGRAAWNAWNGEKVKGRNWLFHTDERKGSRVSKLFTFLSFGSNQLKVNMDFIFCFPFFISGVLSWPTHTSEKRKPTPKEVRLQTRRFWVGTILNLDPGPFLKNNFGVDAEPILLGPDPVPIGKLMSGSRTGFT